MSRQRWNSTHKYADWKSKPDSARGQGVKIAPKRHVICRSPTPQGRTKTAQTFFQFVAPNGLYSPKKIHIEAIFDGYIDQESCLSGSINEPFETFHVRILPDLRHEKTVGTCCQRRCHGTYWEPTTHESCHFPDLRMLLGTLLILLRRWGVPPAGTLWVYLGLSWNRSTPIIHLNRIFHEINHPAIGDPRFLGTPIWPPKKFTHFRGRRAEKSRETICRRRAEGQQYVDPAGPGRCFGL